MLGSRPRACLLLLLAASTAACHQRSTPAKDSLTEDEGRELCLADPGGGLPLDEEIRTHRDRAHQLSIKPDEWLFLGRGWVRKARHSGDPGFYVNVRGCVEAALRVAPGNLAALNLRAMALMNDHKFAEARKVSEEILAKEPKDAMAQGTLSDALLELDRFEEAAAAAQRMVNLKPNMASYARASYLRWLQGDADGAKLLIKYALDGRDHRDPEPTAWTFVQAGTIFWHQGDYDGADAVFTEALAWVGDYPAALVGRARVALARGEPRRAIEFLEKAYRTTRLPETAWLLGDAREMLGDSAGARAEYDRVIEEGKQGDRFTLALFYATKNRSPEEALRLIEEERSVRGGIYIDDAYAWALYRGGRNADARKAIDRAVRLGTRDARLLYHAGAIRLAAGDPEGKALVGEALTLNPKFDWTGAAEAARLVAKLRLNELPPERR